MKGASKVVESEYFVPYFIHTPMEPHGCVARRMNSDPHSHAIELLNFYKQIIIIRKNWYTSAL